MSDFNIEHMWDDSFYKSNENKLDNLGKYDFKLTLEDISKIIKNNISVSRNNDKNVFFNNQDFFDFIKKYIIHNGTEELKLPQEFNHKVTKLYYTIDNIIKGPYNSQNKNVYMDFVINKKSDMKRLNDLYSFSGFLFLTLLQPDTEYKGFFSDFSSTQLKKKIKDKEFYWLSNMKSVPGFEDEQKDLDTINKLKENFYEIAELEGVCPFKIQNMVLNSVLYGENIRSFIKDGFANFFEIVFDDYFLSSLPDLKEKDEDLYWELLENMTKTIVYYNQIMGKHYLNDIEGIDRGLRENLNKNYNSLLIEKKEKLEKLLEKLPLEDLVNVFVKDNFNNPEGISTLIPDLLKFKRQDELLAQLVKKNENDRVRHKI